jgi:hypothetical protein
VHDASKVQMFMHKRSTRAGNDPFSAGEEGNAAAVTGAERDEVCGKLVLILIRKVRNDPLEAPQRGYRPHVRNRDVGN